jgi:hypothetical protein
MPESRISQRSPSDGGGNGILMTSRQSPESTASTEQLQRALDSLYGRSVCWAQPAATGARTPRLSVHDHVRKRPAPHAQRSPSASTAPTTAESAPIWCGMPFAPGRDGRVAQS